MRRSTAFFISIVVLALLKLWLVRAEEITASPGVNVDDWWYLKSAKHWYWGHQHGAFAFIRLPGFPLWVALVQLTGVPLRVATELLQLAAAFVLSVSLLKAGLPQLLCVLLYGAVIFHPLSFTLNNHALPDPFYAAVLLLALAAMIMQLCTRRLRYAVLSGAALAVLWHTREEGVLLVGYVAAVAIIDYLNVRRQTGDTFASVKNIGKPCLVTVSILVAVVLTVKTINYFAFGVFAASEMSSPAFLAANQALLRIKPSTPGHRYIAISRETRQLAYRVSPAFAELEPYFEGERGRAWARFTLEQLQVKDEIAMGWFPWALHDVVALAGHHQSCKEANVFYRRIAHEINQACDEGRLPSRFAFSGTIHPDVREWLSYVPGSFLRVAATFVQIDHLERSEGFGSDANTESRELFDVMANRRSGLTRQRLAHIQGWAFCVADPLQRVEVRDSAQKTIVSTDGFSPRPDVAAFFSGKYDFSTNTGYSVWAPVGSSGQIDASLVYVTKSGWEFVLPGQRIEVGSPKAEPSNGSTKVLEHAIDIVDFPAGPSARVHKVQDFVARWYRRGVIGLTYAGLAAVIVLVAFRQSRQITAPTHGILGLLLVVIAIRMALFTLGDVLSFASCRPRYLFPVMPLYTGVLLIVIYQAIRTLCLRASRR